MLPQWFLFFVLFPDKMFFSVFPTFVTPNLRFDYIGREAFSLLLLSSPAKITLLSSSPPS